MSHEFTVYFNDNTRYSSCDIIGPYGIEKRNLKIANMFRLNGRDFIDNSNYSEITIFEKNNTNGFVFDFTFFITMVTNQDTKEINYFLCLRNTGNKIDLVIKYHNTQIIFPIEMTKSFEYGIYQCNNDPVIKCTDGNYFNLIDIPNFDNFDNVNNTINRPIIDFRFLVDFNNYVQEIQQESMAKTKIIDEEINNTSKKYIKDFYSMTNKFERYNLDRNEPILEKNYENVFNIIFHKETGYNKFDIEGPYGIKKTGIGIIPCKIQENRIDKYTIKSKYTFDDVNDIDYERSDIKSELPHFKFSILIIEKVKYNSSTFYIIVSNKKFPFTLRVKYVNPEGEYYTCDNEPKINCKCNEDYTILDLIDLNQTIFGNSLDRNRVNSDTLKSLQTSFINLHKNYEDGNNLLNKKMREIKFKFQKDFYKIARNYITNLV